MKKKWMSLFLALAMVLGMLPMSVFGADGADPITVYLTVSNKGVLASDNDGKPMACREVTVTDLDASGDFTFDEALIAAHEEFNSPDGYVVSNGMVKSLWGIANDAYLFFVDDVGLTSGVTEDKIEANSTLTAAILTDSTGYSDWYASFNYLSVTKKVGSEFKLKLQGHLGMGYTEEDTQDMPLEGVSVKLSNGTDLGTTDENGKVTLSFDEPGTYIVTASGSVEGVVTNWNLLNEETLDDTPGGHFVSFNWDTYECWYAYTDENHGDGPYPEAEIKYMDAADYFELDEEEESAIHWLYSNRIVKNCPVIAPACLVHIIEDEPAPDVAHVRIVGPDNVEYLPYTGIVLTDSMTLKELTEAAISSQNDAAEVVWKDSGFLDSISDCNIGDDYWMSMLNDSEEPFYTSNFETIEASADDNLVFYPYCNGNYMWINADEDDPVDIMAWEDTTYITGSGSFVLTGLSYDDNWNQIAGPVAGATVTVCESDGTPIDPNAYKVSAVTAETNVEGAFAFDFYGNCPTEELNDYSYTYWLFAEKDGMVTAFCEVTLTAEGLTFSQPAPAKPAEPPEPPVEHKEDIDEDVQALLDTLLAENASRPEAAYTHDWALAMKAAGKTPTEAELEAFKKNALAAARSAGTSVAQKAKWAIALSALGIDATQIPGENGEPIDLVADVYSATEAQIMDQFAPDAYVAPFIVDLYELGMYEIPEDALSEDFLIGLMLDGQGDDGSWYGTYSLDGTGMVLPGLEVVFDRDGVSDAILNAFAYLSDAQADDGSFGNIYSTVMVSMGLHAIGADDHMDEAFLKDDCAIGNILAQEESLTAANTAATLQWQAAWALATFQNLEGSRNQNLYHFDGTVSVCTDWPDADLLTGIAVTTPPDKTVYEIGETFDPAGLVVTATYNADPENTEVVEDGYTLSEPDMTKAGNKTVTVTYQGQTATFVITVRSAGGETPSDYAYITVNGLNETLVAKTKEDIVPGETTALDLLKSVLGREGIPYVIKNGGTYVASIDGLAEFDEGPNSGWLYKVNGSLPGNGTTAASEYLLQSGDNMVWFYTKDYTQEDVVKPTLPKEEPAAQKSVFIDVTDADWYDEYANKAAELGLFAGYEAGTDADGNKLYEFRGKETMNRAMFVTVLRAMETKLRGEPAAAPSAGFEDVKEGDWFEKAVNWAFDKGITAGKGDVYGVDDPVTREQMAVFVYLYAKQIGKVSAEPDLSKLDAFSDKDSIADYAKEAMAWLAGEGLIAGRGSGTIAPAENSTRAEVAAFVVSCYDYLSK